MSGLGSRPPGRLLWLDPVGGVAGDMLCAALLDAGGDLETLQRGLEALGLPGWSLHLERVQRGVFAARRFQVKGDGAPDAVEDAEGRRDDGHAHGHAHGHEHGHAHGHAHGHGHGHDLLLLPVPGATAPLLHLPPGAGPRPAPWAGQPDRSWAEIRALLLAAPLPPRARDRALAVFGRLAQAEAQVHGTELDAVVFHEVGALDSLVDVVGACLLLEQLDVAELVCGPLPLGAGTTRGAHGTIPLPAPATALLLRGWPVRPGRPGEEQVTPTGAALVAALARPGDPPAMVLEAVGTGAGGRNPPDHPNVLRALLGRPIAAGRAPGEGTPQPAATPADRATPTAVEVLAAQVDDLPGEHLPPLFEAVLAAGALDVWASPVLMKKGRSGLLVEALATAQTAEAVGRAILTHGGSFGVRRHPATRQVLDRAHHAVCTPWGPVRIKVGSIEGRVIQAAPEYEDVARIAREAGVPVPRVHAAALRAWGEEEP
ncbi:LarC family nickel insertion protein [Myxococcota bacterium]|nr:LarC family nickel insertion protein [Myxococcota bacterium]